MEENILQENNQENINTDNEKKETHLVVGHAINTKELFEEFNSRTLSFNVDKVLKKYGNKKYFSRMCFVDLFDMILRDIVDNNVTFVLPVPSEIAHMHMRKVEGDDFVAARQRGAFQHIDFLKTNFTAYEIVLSLFSNKRFRVVKVTPFHLFGKIIENTNNGKQYC